MDNLVHGLAIKGVESARMYAYIDESGDPGSGKSATRWLIIGCAMVRDDDVAGIEGIANELAARVSGGQPLHFVRMGHEKKKACYAKLFHRRWWGIVAAADKSKPRPKRLLDPSTLYYEVLKEVLRRILWRAEEYDEPAHIIIDRRQGRFHLDRFKRYLADVNRDDDAYTNWGRLDPDLITEAEPHEEWCLCLPDGLAHATYKLLEPNEFGDREAAYFEICSQRLWGGTGERERGNHWEHQRMKNLLNNGVILLPAEEIGTFLRREFSWLTRQ